MESAGGAGDDTSGPIPGAATSSKGPFASVTAAVGHDVKESLADSIIRLKAEQTEVRESRKRLSRALHNAQRRASRLKKRARQLTDGDLVEVLKMREVKAPVGQASGVENTVQKPPTTLPAESADD